MGKLMFVRMNVVEAIPMTRKEYVESRGWELPANENPDDQVYKVVYADGYVSMCPKDKFYAVSIPCAEGCVPFGYAITECVCHGKRITRKGWNGDGQYVEYKVVEVCYSEESKLVQSHTFVFHFVNRKTGETGIQVGWLASQADMAASDWQVLDE